MKMGEKIEEEGQLQLREKFTLYAYSEGLCKHIPRYLAIPSRGVTEILRLNGMEGDAMSAATISLVNANQQALRQAKRSLRKQMAIQLDALSPSSIAVQSSQIASHILDHTAFKKADKISIYVSMEKGEVKTEELCRQTLALGKRLYVPKFASMAEKGMGTTTFERDMKMLRVKDWDDFEAMVMNKWGIREPEEIVANNKREDALDASTGGDGLDLILAPGVAFDVSGGRLGHGKGYYDRYIGRCEAFEKERGRSGPITSELKNQFYRLTVM